MSRRNRWDQPVQYSILRNGKIVHRAYDFDGTPIVEVFPAPIDPAPIDPAPKGNKP